MQNFHILGNAESALVGNRPAPSVCDITSPQSGMFTPDGESTEPPEAYAIFSGHVLETSVIRIPITQVDFWWTPVRRVAQIST
jgi:hypothetical protein